MNDNDVIIHSFDSKTIIQPLLVIIETMLHQDGRIYVPSELVEEIQFDIPVDLHIKLKNGETVIINREAKGTFRQQSERVNGMPTMVGDVDFL